jgi:hypothetical protein
LSWLDPQLFEMYHVFGRLMHPAVFRGQSGPAGLQDAISGKGRATKMEHEAMVRGLMVGKERRFLEWSIEEGWGPLCEFLGKQVPDVDFAKKNTTREIGQLEVNIFNSALRRIAKRLAVVLAALIAVRAAAWTWSAGTTIAI